MSEMLRGLRVRRKLLEQIPVRRYRQGGVLLGSVPSALVCREAGFMQVPGSGV